ncbi:MAG TPA: hypothetical protein VG675_21180 [Bryobacteraceae bacterium]|nr:hypothetical protein [Bryobacteraceae bacterium]
MRYLLLVSFLVSAAYAQSPVVASGGVVNGANYSSAVAPGSIAAVFGTDLASGLSAADTVPLSTTLGDVQSVTFNGVAAPMDFVSSGQINVQVPWSVGAGTATIVVTRTSGASSPQQVTVATMSPGIFSVDASGKGQALAINNADGSIAAPSNSIQGIATHPAKVGDALILYANGLGPVDPPVEDGHDSTDQLRKTVNTPIVTVGNVQAQVLFSGLSPQFPGVNQINIVVPSGVPTGDAVPLQIQLGGVTTTASLTIAIQ